MNRSGGAYTPAPERVRALAERLIAIPSVSPDPAAETQCARVLAEQLPTSLERGEWSTSDGRPVLWALLRGRSPRTVVLLGHYDTVGISEFAALGHPDRYVAFDTQALPALLARYARTAERTVAPEVLADLDEEARCPGTWLFGR